MNINSSLQRFLAVTVVFLTTSVTSALNAQWSHDSNINNPICTAPNGQYVQVMVGDGAGGYIVTWEDFRTNSNYDIYAQRIDYTGTTVWTANGVAVCTTVGDQTLPAIISDGAGGAIITWHDMRNGTDGDIYAQRVDHNGNVQWTANGVAICAITGEQNYPAMVSDGSGGAIITWQDARSGTNGDIYAQRVNAGGAVQWAANGVAISTAANNQLYPAAASDGAGGALIAWEDNRSGTSYDIYAQRVNSAGVTQWSPNGLSFCTSPNDQTSPQLLADGAGGVFMVWQDYRSATNYDIYAQHVTSGGLASWTLNGLAVTTAPGDQSNPAFVTDRSGGIIVVWQDYRSGTNYDIYAQRVGGSGAVAWAANGVAVCNSPFAQINPQCVPDGQGGAVIAWSDLRSGSFYDVYAQRIDATGASQWIANGMPISTALNSQFYLVMCSDGNGGAAMAWQDQRAGLSEIFAQNIDRYGNLGNPSALMMSVKDILDDQGGKVAVSWSPSYMDVYPAAGILSYNIYLGVTSASLPSGSVVQSPQEYEKSLKSEKANNRVYMKMSTGPAVGQSLYWQQVGSVTPQQLEGYSFFATTPSDSGPQGIPWYYFMVRTNANSGEYWTSNVDSGYSVDNLPPGPVMTVSASPQAGPSVNVHWRKDTSDPDVGLYEVHRSTVDGFTPGPTTKIGQTSDTALVDASPVNGSPNYYRIVTVDIHGNKSVPSQQASAGVTLMSQYAVSDKWNLVSVPLTVGNYAKSVLYPTAVSNAFSYAGGYAQQATLSNGAGYWLKFAGGQNVSMTGFLISNASIPVQAGWNLIGSISTSVPVGSITSDPPGMVASNFFGYESGYKVATQIDPGKGYWIKVNQSGTLHLAPSSNVAAENRIRITPDGELPPAPPDAQISNLTSQIPTEFSLGQNYPNPFNPTTNFEYRIANVEFVSLKIYDVLGREVATLVNEQKPAGEYNVTWDATALPSGVYIYKLSAGNFTEQKKLLLLK